MTFFALIIGLLGVVGSPYPSWVRLLLAAGVLLVCAVVDRITRQRRP